MKNRNGDVIYRLWGHGHVWLKYGKLHVEREMSAKSYVYRYTLSTDGV